MRVLNKVFCLIVFTLICIRANSQGDTLTVSSSNRGTIKVRKPGKNIYCKVQADYFVYTKQGDGPKVGKLKNGLVYFKRNNKIKNDGEPGNPRPIFSGTAINKTEKPKTDGPTQSDSVISLYSEADYSAYFTDTVH